VDVSSNELTAEGGADILEVLAYNESIVEMNVSSFEGLHRNTIGAHGAKPL
jgi:hypothetical protein